MKILLTGYKGFIGSHLASALAGHELTLFDYSNDVPNIQQFDWVVHVGAISSTTERNVELVMKQNYDFSVDLYRECRFHGVNFQFASSASVYGLNSEFSEDSPVDPCTPYAWSKYMFERFVAKYPPKNSLAQIFRYFNVYGPEGESHKGNQSSPFYKFKQQAEIQGYVEVFEGAQARRDFVHVSRVVDTHCKFFNVPESGIWNVGSGQTLTFEDIAYKYTSKVKTIPMPEQLKSSYQYYTCADLTKLNATLSKYSLTVI